MPWFPGTTELSFTQSRVIMFTHCPSCPRNHFCLSRSQKMPQLYQHQSSLRTRKPSHSEAKVHTRANIIARGNVSHWSKHSRSFHSLPPPGTPHSFGSPSFPANVSPGHTVRTENEPSVPDSVSNVVFVWVPHFSRLLGTLSPCQ